MRTIVKIIAAAIVAMGMVCVLVAHDVDGRTVVGVYFLIALTLCAVLGVFDEKREGVKHESIKHYSGRLSA